MKYCAGCTTAYAPDLDTCPHCGSDRTTTEEETMPKISRAGGPSTAADIPAPPRSDQDTGQPTKSGTSDREETGTGSPGESIREGDEVTLSKSGSAHGEAEDTTGSRQGATEPEEKPPGARRGSTPSGR